MLLANKHFTPILGIDIHVVVIPPGIPTPIPHPFIGMVMDPMDYIPVIGATVFINGVPNGNTQTTGMLGTKVHFPLGGPFLMMPVIGHESSNFFGSATVKADGSSLAPSGHMLMTCNDLGMPLGISPGKKPKLSLYLPTSSSIPIPMGAPVMVAGPYPPDIMGAITGLVMSFGFGKLMKKVGKVAKKGLTKLNHSVLKKFKSTKGLSKKFCKMGFEPVDLITGRMVYEGEDFRVPGPFPIVWERNWYSDSPYEGALGHGMHHNYDISLEVDLTENIIVLRLPDGRLAGFDLILTENSSSYNRLEKRTLTCIDGNTYKIKDHETQETLVFTRKKDSHYKLTSLQNAEGFEIKFVYNAATQLESMIDAAGRVIQFGLKNGKITKVSLHHKNQSRTLIQYAYNEEGDLTHIIDALEKATVMEYENHLMVKKTDRNGQAFYWEYDGKETGAKCTKTWGDDNILAGEIAYGKGINYVTNSLGNTSTYYFNDDNLCTQVMDPEGASIFHEYTPFQEFYRDIDEEGNTTGYTYDDRGNLTSIHQPDGAATVFVYDDEDRLILNQSPEGGAVSRAYEDGKIFAIIGMDGGVTSFMYNTKGHIAEIRDNAGNQTELVYDEDGNLTQMQLPNGATSHWKYDVWGRCIQTKNAGDHKQDFVYDTLDRLKTIYQPDKNQIRLKYNAYDEVIESIDQNNRKINFEYTPMGSLKMRQEKNSKVHFNYNTEEELVYITNEHEEYYRFVRDTKGHIINEIGFDGLSRTYHRDLAGKVIKVHRPDDRFTEYEYNLNGQITRAEHYDSTWETYGYNKDGLLIEAVNQHTHVILQRDETGRVLKEIQDGHEVESTYDGLGNRTQITSSLGADINIKRNKEGFITQLNAAGSYGKQQQEWEANYNYNSLGQEVERILPGGIIQKQAYDFAGRPIRQKITVKGKETRHRTYAWNVNDRLNQMVNELTKGQVTYKYDSFNNLAGAKYENGQMDYKLPDEVGNLYRNANQNDREYGKGGKLLKAKGNTYTYDAEGNLIAKGSSKGIYKYEWYGNGMLKTVNTPEDNTITFEYDALGRRIAKLHNEKIKRWVWDGNTTLHEWEYAIKNRPQLIIDAIGFLQKDREESTENLITWVFDEGTFKPTAKITENDTYSIITDYLGTPVEMYNSKGDKTWEADYDIYGKIRNLVTGSLKDCPFRYQGQYEDVETGLYYNRFRYYSPDEGVYISQDPIRLMSGEANFYSYVSDSNVWVDVFGLSGTLTIFADSPKGDPIGHAFIKVTEGGKTAHVGQWPNPGFQKNDLPKIMVSDMGGALNHNDISHLNSSVVSRTYDLDDNQMKNLKSFIKDFDAKNTGTKGYNLRSRQCASFAYGAARAAGIDDIKMPWYKWVTPNSLANKINSLNAKACCK